MDLHSACYRAHAQRMLALLALRLGQRRVVASQLEPGSWTTVVRDWLAPEGMGVPDPEALKTALVHASQLAVQAETDLADAGWEFAPLVVARTFDLTAAETEFLLLAVLVLLEPRLSLLIACARGAPELAMPTVAVALDLFCWEAAERAATVARLLAGSPLQAERLVIFGRPAGGRQAVPWLEREFEVATGLAALLLGASPEAADTADKLLPVRMPKHRMADLVIGQGVRTELEPVLQAGADLRAIVLLRGPPGSGRTALAEAIAAQRGSAVLAVDAGRLAEVAHGGDELVEALAQARLCNALPVVHADGGALYSQDGQWQPMVSTLQRLCGRWPGLLVWIGGPSTSLDTTLLDRPIIAVDLNRPGTASRREIWAKLLPHWLHFDGPDPVADAAHWPLTPQQMATVSRDMALCAGQGRGRRTVAAGRFQAACRAALASGMQGLGQRIEPQGKLGSLILPPQTEADLAEIAARVRHRELVLDRWGFGKRFSRGRGLTFLLSGPPGTGKSSAVEQVAGELGQAVYRVDLARLTSKYVGETEKNLGSLFDQAEGSGMILLFDEADSLFSARTAVRSSMDRFANQSVNYLLERIESYEGVAFLTSNLPDALDEAFRRRLAMHVSFPEPTAEERARLWRSMVPQQAPLDANVRWEELGRTFAITGGYIKNAVLRAAVMAAERNTTIDHAVLCEAARRECQGLGRVVRAV